MKEPDYSEEEYQYMYRNMLLETDVGVLWCWRNSWAFRVPYLRMAKLGHSLPKHWNPLQTVDTTEAYVIVKNPLYGADMGKIFDQKQEIAELTADLHFTVPRQ